MRNIRVNDKQDERLQQAESGMEVFFWVVFAVIAAFWLCHDTSAGLSESIKPVHYTNHDEVNVLHWLGVI